MIATESASFRQWLEQTGARQSIVAAVAGIEDVYVSRHARGLRIGPRPLVAIERAVEDINDVLTDIAVKVPNLTSVESVRASIKHLRQVRAAKAEEAKQPLVFATSRPIYTKAPIDAVPTNLFELARVMGSDQQSDDSTS